jgi:uncharacterized protein
MELMIDCGRHGSVPALLDEPADAEWLLVLGHGAGAGMRHPFMEAVATGLAARGLATLRYQFPFMEAGRKLPDRTEAAVATVRAAVDAARAVCPSLPLLAGGKSFGARMTAHAAADGLLPDVRGLVFLGFPLHPSGKPSTTRAAPLALVTCPLLFVQGTRDKLADLALLHPILDDLGHVATLHRVEGADHSFQVLKRSGRTDADVMAEVCDAVADFDRRLRINRA